MIRFKQTKKFSKPSLEKLLNSYAEETGMIDESTVKELLKSKDKDKLTEHLVEWDKLIDNSQDDEALKKADEIRKMIRGQKEFSESDGSRKRKLVYVYLDRSGRLDVYEAFESREKAESIWTRNKDKLKLVGIPLFYDPRSFSDDKMLFVEYVDEDGDTTHQVMKQSEFEQVKDEARTNRTSGAKLKILTEEVYDETNPKHKKYKDHPVTETKEFSKCPIEADKELRRFYVIIGDKIFVSKLGFYVGDEVDEQYDLLENAVKGIDIDEIGDNVFNQRLIDSYKDKKWYLIPDKYFNGAGNFKEWFKDHLKGTKSFSDDREQVPQYIADEVDKNGVIVKYKDSWRIVSKKQKPYEFWDAHYDTKEDAEKALDAYHANK